MSVGPCPWCGESDCDNCDCTGPHPEMPTLQHRAPWSAARAHALVIAEDMAKEKERSELRERYQTGRKDGMIAGFEAGINALTVYGETVSDDARKELEDRRKRLVERLKSIRKTPVWRF